MSRAARPRRGARAWLLVAALALALAGCMPGPYPIDIFPEMHRQPSQRRLEPERRSPPPDAVPVAGGRPSLTFDQAAALANPLPPTAETLERGRRVYQINCAACHGPEGHGDGFVAAYFQSAGRVPPVDFASARARARSDGQLYWIIVHGLGGMPPFGDLLDDNDVWALVSFIRQTQGQP